MKKNFVYGEDCFRPHLCVQCKHFFPNGNYLRIYLCTGTKVTL